MIQQGRLKILLVEDHVDTLEAVRDFLVTHQHAVTISRTMKEAVRFAKRDSFDLLITDLCLPDGDGWELLSRMRQIQPVEALAMSGFGGKTDIARSKTAGFREHLVKPFIVHRLETALAEILSERKSKAAA
jgi:DNA-binding response OmpR family regulator